MSFNKKGDSPRREKLSFQEEKQKESLGVEKRDGMWVAPDHGERQILMKYKHYKAIITTGRR